ncbi:MAG: L-serine ammonia-lyase [Gammaproteobacteria bacterium]|nr:L-serine ammonia-lyase [Gammaproteobacteria bacterium]
MFISVLELFKPGIGPSSSHTMGPMNAAAAFITQCKLAVDHLPQTESLSLRCTLKGSLAYTGKGHGSDKAIIFGVHGYLPETLAGQNIQDIYDTLAQHTSVSLSKTHSIHFEPQSQIIFDTGPTLPQHPNGLIFELLSAEEKTLISQTYFSIGGGFIKTLEEIDNIQAPLSYHTEPLSPFGFDSANSMLKMAKDSGKTIAQMKWENELARLNSDTVSRGLDRIWNTMHTCMLNGLRHRENLPGGLNLERRAARLHEQLLSSPKQAENADWLCAYAMAVNEENAAGNTVVTAPTNGAAGVIPAILYYELKHHHIQQRQIHEFLLTAAAIGGIIKHRSSISGAEVGCQGEIGSAAAMAAAGLCAIRGGNPEQIENAAEIALEHHLGMTCDPVQGLVQIPCIERNGFGAVKAYTAASLALHSDGRHFVSLDNCIAAMKQTGLEMSHKFKETSLGGLAVSITEC